MSDEPRSGYFKTYNHDMMDLRLRLPRETVAALWGAAFFAATEETAQTTARTLIDAGLASVATSLGKDVGAERV